MSETEAREAKTDNQGRIIDVTGRPLRDRRSRTAAGAFRGTSGKPHPRQARLDRRIAGFESVSNKGGYRKPGSLSK